jgi:hypothetical protein
MANLFPLILNTTSSTIQELPSGDNLDLSGSNISNVANITSAANVTASYFIGNGSSLTGITASPAGSNTQIQFNNAGVFGANSNFFINTTTGLLSAPNFSGNGASLSSITGANVTGTVSSATSATTAGTVTTAAQPNITSTGILTTLTVSGNLVPTNIVLDSFNETVLANANTSTSITPNVLAGTIFRYTANSNFTFNSLGNAVAGTSATVIITQDATGSRLLTSTMKFAGNSKTLSTAASSIDIIGVFYDGTTYYASLTKGYV